MSTVDSANNWRELTEHYRRLTDDELIAIAQDSADLTDTAQKVLNQEIALRRLSIDVNAPPPPPTSEPDPDEFVDVPDPYADDRQLVTIITVWSRADAEKLQHVLERAGFPFFIGPEKATSAAAITSSFADGLDVKVMKIGVLYASNALRQLYAASDEPAELKEESDTDAGVHCPKCHSDDVIFDQLIGQDSRNGSVEESSTQKFQWTCNACGNEWEDDGIEK